MDGHFLHRRNEGKMNLLACCEAQDHRRSFTSRQDSGWSSINRDIPATNCKLCACLLDLSLVASYLGKGRRKWQLVIVEVAIFFDAFH